MPRKRGIDGSVEIGVLEIGVLENDEGGFASEFEEDRLQMLRRGDCKKFSDARRSGEAEIWQASTTFRPRT
jgi:hypothetical protein